MRLDDLVAVARAKFHRHPWDKEYLPLDEAVYKAGVSELKGEPLELYFDVVVDKTTGERLYRAKTCPKST